MKHPAVTLGLLLAALAFYALGLETGATALLVLGGCLELWFWARVAPGLGLFSRRARGQAARK